MFIRKEIFMPDGIQFTINEEELKKQITNAVFGTLVGDVLTAQVKAVMNITDYNSPIKDAVRESVKKILQKLLETEYRDQLESAVRLAINEDVLKKIIEQATNHTMSMLKDRDR